jgi:hypothetical protein
MKQSQNNQNQNNNSSTKNKGKENLLGIAVGTTLIITTLLGLFNTILNVTNSSARTIEEAKKKQNEIATVQNERINLNQEIKTKFKGLKIV